jgi:polyisoprenoid-binding protein YceI
VSPCAVLEGGIATGVWELDSGTSVLAFTVKHFWGAVNVRGRFGAFVGRLDIDASGTVSGSIEAEAASLDSGNVRRDKHLRSADFFDVASHPSVRFSIGQVEPLTDDILRVSGDLSAAGRSQPVTFDAILSDATAERVTVDGAVRVDRTGFGMTWSPMRMASSTAVQVCAGHPQLVQLGVLSAIQSDSASTARMQMAFTHGLSTCPPRPCRPSRSHPRPTPGALRTGAARNPTTSTSRWPWCRS